MGTSEPERARKSRSDLLLEPPKRKRADLFLVAITHAAVLSFFWIAVRFVVQMRRCVDVAYCRSALVFTVRISPS